MKKYILLLTLLILILAVQPAQALNSPQESEPVIIYLFWADGCPHCAIARPALHEFAARHENIELREYEVWHDPDNQVLFVKIMADLGLQPRAVPTIIIGNHYWEGYDASVETEMETVIADCAKNICPDPGLVLAPESISTEPQPAQSEPTPRPSPTHKTCHICDEGLPIPVVHAVMFWMDGCLDCGDVIDNVLPPLRDKYGSQFDVLIIEVSDTRNIDMLFYIAESYDIPKEQTGVPFLIIGDHALVGFAEIREQLPALIDGYLAQGGVDLPSNPVLEDLLPQTSPVSLPTSEMPAVSESAPPVDTAPAAPAHMQSNGFTLAIVIMIGMGLALLYGIVAFAMGKTFTLPKWGDWPIPILIVIGIGVAGYLSYVEARSVEAICGPVGDCNTVQQSRYAKLFDFLPVGVLGLLGYLGLLTAWLTRKYLPKFAKPADIAFFGMAFFAVIFSLYLTYLEPFVIGAVCIWCLTSAVIVTLLLLIGTPAAVRQFTISDEDEPYANET